jgi:hypothetical protein
MLENQLELPEEDDTIVGFPHGSIRTRPSLFPATPPIHRAFGQHPAGDHACLPSGRTTLHMLQMVRPSYDHSAHTSSSQEPPTECVKDAPMHAKHPQAAISFFLFGGVLTEPGTT